MAKLATVSTKTGTVFRSAEKMQKALQRDWHMKKKTNLAWGLWSF